MILVSTPDSTISTVSQTAEGVAITTLVNSISMTGSLMTTRLINEGGAATTQEESTSSSTMENSGLEITDQMLEEAQYTTMDSLEPECKYIWTYPN